MPKTRANRRRSAYSLVEVVASIALMAATLVPAMQLVRAGMERSVENDRRELLALYAVSQLEQRLGPVAMGWTVATTTGDYSADGHPAIRYETVSTDSPLSGGITGLLMDVRTNVYFDEDGNGALSAGELQCSYRTKVGNFATYTASGS